MNIETANRLAELRKKNGLSQEELASKLGISRQAVSKWERAEASPDTDNLICLARLYGISLDDLLNVGGAVNASGKEQAAKDNDKGTQPLGGGDEKPMGSEKTDAGAKSDESIQDAIRIDSSGIHVRDANGSILDIDGQGIKEKKGDVPYDGRRPSGIKAWHFEIFHDIVGKLLSVLAVIAFLLMGFLWTENAMGWRVGWIVFLLVPIGSSLSSAIKKKKFTSFDFPILVAAIYLILGLGWGLWHPEWIIFLAIPVYYAIFAPIDKALSAKRAEKDNDEAKANEKEKGT